VRKIFVFPLVFLFSCFLFYFYFYFFFCVVVNLVRVGACFYFFLPSRKQQQTKIKRNKK